MIFRLHLPPNHPLFDVPLAYVYWFSDPLPMAELDINMYKVQYLRGGNNYRTGGIIFLRNISRLIQLVPFFSPNINPDLSVDNSMDVWRHYHVNSFMDKETYQAVW